jgi:acetylglutamate kinase
MANYTTLAAACSASDQQIVVTSATGFAVGQPIVVDGEYMVQIAAAIATTTIPVQRGGKNGSVQSAHAILSTVGTGTNAEFPGPQAGWPTNPAIYKKVQVSYGASGAIAPPTCDTIVFLNKATAGAMTLVSPTGATPDGTEVTIYSNTAAAHTVTYTAGFNQDTTASDVATFAATSGNSMTMIASRGVWGLKCVYGVTVA